ncbi:MAG: ammonium transporter [Hymenobacteraceae bacterium]|nr:ammonium transporter [Hymenobacteraceae bacterium]
MAESPVLTPPHAGSPPSVRSTRRPPWSAALGLLILLTLVGALVPGTTLSPATGGPISGADTAWLLTASGLVLLMTPGLSFFYGGMVSRQSLVSTMLQSFVALGVVSVLWVTVGFSLAFGTSWHGLIGSPLTFAFFRHVGLGSDAALSPTVPLLLFALFQLKFAIITPALITGSFAGRVRFSGYLVFMTLFTLLIYTPLAHWTWHPEGFLRRWGILDFAGGTVVHLSAGLAALAGVAYLGPRRAHVAGHTEEPANIPYVLLGTGMLWFGWFGFNAGSALGANALAVQAFATTNSASAAAMLAWLLLDAARGQKITALGACIGAVVGLVAITPAAGFVTVPQSLLIGVVASLISNYAVRLKHRVGLDDTLDVFPCHGLGGAVGMVLTAVFAQEGGLLATGDPTLLLKHLAALALVAVFVLGGSWALYWLTARIVPLRVTEEEEAVGLDLSQHGESA